MCPACMATVALLIASAVSSGGLVVVSKLLAPKGAKNCLRENKSSEGSIGEATDEFASNRSAES